MRKKAVKLPIAPPTQSGGPTDTEELTALLQRSSRFRWVVAKTMALGGSLIGYREAFQSFDEWCRELKVKTLKPDVASALQSLVAVARCSRRRSGAVIFTLYLFGQQQRTQARSEECSEPEADAARAINERIESFVYALQPHLNVLDTAPGMWRFEAERARTLLAELATSVKPASGKRTRKSAHRTLDQDLLRFAALFSGRYRSGSSEVRPIPFLVRLVLGASPNLSVDDALAMAQVAAWAAGTWRSLDVLKHIYYEVRDPAWRAIARHALYHLGWADKSSKP